MVRHEASRVPWHHPWLNLGADVHPPPEENGHSKRVFLQLFSTSMIPSGSVFQGVSHALSLSIPLCMALHVSRFGVLGWCEDLAEVMCRCGTPLPPSNMKTGR